MLDYSPGPFLKPSALTSSAFIPITCFNRWKNLEDIKFAQLNNEGIVFCDVEKRPIFEKRFAHLDSEFWVEDDSVPTTTITFKKSLRIWDDIGISISLNTVAEADVFTAQLRQVFTPDTTDFCLPTKTYVLDGKRAKLVPPTHVISQIINTTLTALAYTDIAEVLSPVWDWSIGHTETLLVKAKADVQAWLRSNLPPLIIITGDDAYTLENSNTFKNLEFRDDLEGTFDTDIIPILPQKPTWPLKQISPPHDDELWLQQIITNYGVHQRQRDPDSHERPFIVISMQLIRWLLAAVEGTANSASRGVMMSLHAATASIKTTLIHELAHLWVTQKTKGNSPLRSAVRGAQGRKFNVAEDEENTGTIEAGCLVETAWLGGPHKLVLDKDGWLRFVVWVTPDDNPLSSPMSSASNSSLALEDNSDLTSRTFLHRFIQRPSGSDDTHSASSSASEDSVSSSDSLGSPIQLQPGPICYNEAIVAVEEEEDGVQHVLVCDADVLESLWAPGLPHLPDGIVGDWSPLIRNKKHNWPSSSPPTPRARPSIAPALAQRLRPDNLIGRQAVPLLKGEGLPPKWPSVLRY